MSYTWDFSILNQSASALSLGMLLTVEISLASMAIALIAAMPITLLRVSTHRGLSAIGTCYTEFFRATPALVQVVWIFYALPPLIGVTLSPVTAGILALSLTLAAFVSEVYRAGIKGVPAGVREASLALGHRPHQTYIRVLGPLALRRMVPPLGSLWISLFKDSSIVSIIGVHELMYESRVLAIDSYRPLEVFTAVAIIYYVVTCPQAIFVEFLYKKFRAGE
ncbi:amino acid ABC transporter permease [Mesorhizobium sp. M1005]|uniref:amino acid ABC transporter permease n=1 Tax=unclassified Mesorhizobium TaxID=325217 RepID=UPI003338051D